MFEPAFKNIDDVLEARGRGGLCIGNTYLSNTDNAAVSLRKLLLESCILHTVLDCPGGTFLGAGVKKDITELDRESGKVPGKIRRLP